MFYLLDFAKHTFTWANTEKEVIDALKEAQTNKQDISCFEVINCCDESTRTDGLSFLAETNECHLGNKPHTSTVSFGAYQQCKWERDTAIQQLADLGYGFGEKIREDDDAVSRKEVIKLLYCIPSEEGITRSLLLDAAENLQRVVPKNNSSKEECNIKSCKTCAHWNCRAWDPPCNKCYRGSGLLQDNYEPNQGTKKDWGKEDPQ